MGFSVKVMGCVLGKASAVEDSGENESNKGSSELKANRVTSSKRQEMVKRRLDRGDTRVGSSDRKLNGSNRVIRDYHFVKKREDSEVIASYYQPTGSIPKATEGEQIIAGWPSWLAEVAGEAIKGWIPRGSDTFEKLDKIGQGTYSNVYKARDLINKKVVALKRVRFDNKDPESVKFMAREILILRRLEHPNIIKLEGLVTSRASCSLYLVFEYMEHDLTGLASLPGVKFSEQQVKCYMQQLLSGLDHCHSRGVLHRDIKGSNLLIDNHGILKIADFGLASFYDHHESVPLTSRVVTLWYRPPELLLGATHYGVSVDLWSAGCILGELYAGKPILPGRTEVEQLHKIFKLCGSPSEDYWRKSKLPHSTAYKPLQHHKGCLAETFRGFTPTVAGLIETLLSLDPANRGTAAHALKSEYFTTEPLACDPSCLPKYPPSKEIDCKMREEELRRQGGAGGRGQRVDRGSGGPKLPRGIPAPNGNAELVTSVQGRQGYSDVQSRSEVFKPYQEEPAWGFPINRPRQTQAVKEVGKALMDRNRRGASHSGPLIPGVELTKTGSRYDDTAIVSTRGELSTSSGLVASRTSSAKDCQDKASPAQLEDTNQVGRSSQSSEVSGTTTKNGRKLRMQSVTSSREAQKEMISDHGLNGNRIQFSGPLIVPFNNVDRMLKERDRHIQDAARRARLERARLRLEQCK